MTTRVSKASPKLLDAMAKGTHLADAVLYVRKRADLKAGAEFMQIRLKNVMVSSYQVTPGDADGGFLVEEVTFAFDEGGMDYRRVRPDGTLARAVQFKGVSRCNFDMRSAGFADGRAFAQFVFPAQPSRPAQALSELQTGEKKPQCCKIIVDTRLGTGYSIGSRDPARFVPSARGKRHV